jgi:aerotaxis receptor
MKIQSVAPTGQAQHFEVNETFFSTTDERGVISSGNGVFSRTSGYALEELAGQPHNLIRHPDIPRCVFKLLWETCKAGKPFSGYVKNQARNGNHYWVLAIIVPIPGGYLSVRIKPTTPLLGTVEGLYAKLLAVEKAELARGTSEGGAATASAKVLGEALESLGFQDYAAFSHASLNAEIRSRDEQLAQRHLRLFPENLPHGADPRLVGLFGQTRITYERLSALAASLSPFTMLSEGIRKRREAVQDIAERFRINALNAHIAAHPLGSQGVVIGTVAQFLNNHAQALAENAGILASGISSITAAVSSIAGDIGVARIQIEMLLSFLAEGVRAGETREGNRGRDLRIAFSGTVGRALASIRDLRGNLPAVQECQDRLRRDIVHLHVAQISGLTEASRLSASAGFTDMFASLRSQIESARKELVELDEIVDHLSLLTTQAPPQVSAIFESVTVMESLME